MEIESIVISASVTIFSLGLLLISLLVKGIALSIGLFYPESSINFILSDKYSGLFDLIILILLFIATLKR